VANATSFSRSRKAKRRKKLLRHWGKVGKKNLRTDSWRMPLLSHEAEKRRKERSWRNSRISLIAKKEIIVTSFKVYSP